MTQEYNCIVENEEAISRQACSHFDYIVASTSLNDCDMIFYEKYLTGEHIILCNIFKPMSPRDFD